MTVQCDILILCEVHVEVVIKSVLLLQKVSVQKLNETSDDKDS